jgi:hypothetical protein
MAGLDKSPSLDGVLVEQARKAFPAGFVITT